MFKVIIFNTILERKSNIRMNILWIIIKDMVMKKDLTNNLYNIKIKKDMYQNLQDHTPAIIKLVKNIFNLKIWFVLIKIVLKKVKFIKLGYLCSRCRDEHH